MRYARIRRDEQERHNLQEYIFELEEVQDQATELAIAHEQVKRLHLSCTTHGLCLVPNRTFVWCNRVYTEILGWETDELRGQSTEITYPDNHEYEKMGEVVYGNLEQQGLRGFALAAAYSYATEGRQKKAIRGMFGQYMSETVINHLLAHPEKLKLGGERRRVTLFFSDLAGFTTLSEPLEAETVVALLNDYLSRMTEIILDETGTVDKFEGDAIMAFWGAPLDQEDQAIRACRAALAQQAALTELNRSFAQQNLPTLKVRIGLHTGDAIVGNLGSAKRFDYTVIGDTVNLASRLEGLNKFYGTAIMASEATVQECGDEMACRELDLVAVKGRETPVRVFEVMALKGELTAATAARKEKFAQGLEFYRQGDFSPAAAAFAAALKLAPGDGPSQAFLNRCRLLKANPPPAPWDTVFRPDAK